MQTILPKGTIQISQHTASQCPDVPLLNTYDIHVVVRVAGMLQGRTEGGRSTVLQEHDSRIYTMHQGLDRWGWAGMWHVWGTTELRTEFWYGNLQNRDQLEDLGVD